MATTETVAFYFDPLCPWAWVTSRWATRLEELGELEIDWRVFSLGIANLPEGQAISDQPVGYGAEGLQLLVQAKRLGGHSSIAKLYTALGRAAHVSHQDLREKAVLEQAWEAAGLDPADGEAALTDPTLWQEVVSQHLSAVDSCRAFGVPTLILDGGAGPGIFGPIITEVPSDEECLELLRDVVRMSRRDYFFELKRDREGHPARTGA
ncbi:MAG: DsbA family protein [Candidatus Dormiibacterota bacterium]